MSERDDAHDPEKWEPVFGTIHAQPNREEGKSHADATHNGATL